MKRAFQIAAIAAALAIPAIAFADGSVKITSPTEGAKVPLSGVKVAYEVEPGKSGDHVHVYVDGEEAGLVRQLKGSYTIAKLSGGEHNICVKVVDKGHTPTGAEKCVKVTASGSSMSNY